MLFSLIWIQKGCKEAVWGMIVEALVNQSPAFLGAQVRLEHCMAVELQEKVSAKNFVCEAYYIPGHAALSEAKGADLLW